MGIKVLLVIVFVIPILFFSALFCILSRQLQSMEAQKEPSVPKEAMKLEFNTLSKREMRTTTMRLLRKDKEWRKRRWHM